MVQVLQGHEDAVMPLFERIKLDPRHTDIKMVTVQSLRSRHYAMIQKSGLPQYVCNKSRGEPEIR